jgi:hypothetical protein
VVAVEGIVIREESALLALAWIGALVLVARAEADDTAGTPATRVTTVHPTMSQSQASRTAVTGSGAARRGNRKFMPQLSQAHPKSVSRRWPRRTAPRPHDDAREAGFSRDKR